MAASIRSQVSAVRTRDSSESDMVGSRNTVNLIGHPLPAKGVRTSNPGRSADRRDVWLGLKPDGKITSEPWSLSGINGTNKSTHGSGRRGEFKSSKKDLDR